jgi:methyl-accepting chemotaxis protein
MNAISNLKIHSLRAKLCLSFLLVAVVPLSLISYLAYYQTRVQLIDGSGVVLQEKASQTLDKIDRNLFERYGDVQAFAFSNQRSQTAAELQESIDFLTKTYGCYDLMLVANENGTIIAANSIDHLGQAINTRALIGQSVRGEMWFEQCISGVIQPGQTYFRDAEVDRWVSQVNPAAGLTLNFSAPVFNAEGKPVKVWSNRASFRRTAGQILDDLRGMSGNSEQDLLVQLVNRSGAILNHEGPQSEKIDSPAELDFTALGQTNDRSAGFSYERNPTTGGMEVVGFATSLGSSGFPGYGWRILAKQQASSALSVAVTLRNLLVLFVALSTAVVFGVAFFLATRISTPISKVVTALGKLAAGDLSCRVDHSANDEIGNLAKSLNQSMEEISVALQTEQADWGELQVRTEITNATNIVSLADLKGDIIDCNDLFSQVSQYSREELIGRPHNLVRHPDVPKDVYKQLWATIGRGQMYRGILKNRKKDGSPYYVDLTIAPVMGKNNKPRKYVGVRYDITESEIARQNAQGVLDALNKSFAYIEFDPQGRILQANDNFLSVVGYRREELQGQHHRMFESPEQAGSLEYTRFWESLQRGETFAGVFPRVSKSGQRVWIQAAYSPVTDETGRVTKVVKVASDITAVEEGNLRLRQKVDQILEIVRGASQGDLTQTIEIQGVDPIGLLAAELNRFFATLRDNIATIGENATALAGASEELSAVSSQMSANATQTAAQATIVSNATEEVNVNVAVVSTGVDELNAAIREIAKNASDAARVSQQAVTIAGQTNTTISKLGDSSMEIGKVVNVITSIAEQTNLLALNATIEAARAGEAGKGFAVVANEVKELAKETAKATEDISKKIETIQADTNGAIEAIHQISDVINQINDISNTIASAVEEQTATANEMGRNVAEAARGSAEIAHNITAVAEATQANTEGVNNSMQAAGELSRMAGELQRLVGQFKYHRESVSAAQRGFAPVSSSYGGSPIRQLV